MTDAERARTLVDEWLDGTGLPVGEDARASLARLIEDFRTVSHTLSHTPVRNPDRPVTPCTHPHVDYRPHDPGESRKVCLVCGARWRVVSGFREEPLEVSGADPA